MSPPISSGGVHGGLGQRLAHPSMRLVNALALAQPARGLGAVVLLDRVEGSPVDLGVVDHPVLAVLVRRGGGERVAELQDLGNVAVEELLAQVLVRARLDLPSEEEILLDVRPGAEEM